MYVRLDACVSAVAAEAGLDPDNNSQDKTNIKRWINDTRKEVYSLPVRFSALEFVGEFAGTAVVTAGTVNATQNQAEVTGSSTAFTTAMSGRYIMISTGQWKRISYVSDSTHLTLESSWTGDTVTNQSYMIWKRDYEMPHKVGTILNIFDMGENRYPLAFYDQSEFYQKFGWGDTLSNPQAFTQFGSSDLGLAYLTSTVYTVTTTADSPIVDFAAGSGVVTGLAPGDRLIIGNSSNSTAFYVDRILTDTKVSLRNFVTVSTGSTSATAFATDRLFARFFPGINDTRTYYFEAYKRCYDLYSDDDMIEDGWYPAVKKGAIAKALGYVRDPREAQKLAEAQAEIATLIRNQYRAKNPSPRLKPHITRRYGTSPYSGVFPAKYDTGY